MVVGGGAAGLSAAIAAAEMAASAGMSCQVTVVEAAESVGGSTARAVGSITASETALQRRRGITDNRKHHLEDLLAGQENEFRDASRPLLDAVAKDSGDAVDWLERLGVQFTGPHPEPPHRVPRMHSAQPNGQGLLARLEEHALGHGVNVVKGARAVEILRQDGVIRAVRAEGKRSAYTANSVIIAAGDASATFRHEDPSEPPPVYRHALGDAFKLARPFDAELYDPLPSCQIRSAKPPHYHPDRDFFDRGVVAVDRAGRFLADRHRDLANVLNRRGEAFLIFDRKVAAQVATVADDGPDCRDGWLRPGKCFVSTFEWSVGGSPAVGRYEIIRAL